MQTSFLLSSHPPSTGKRIAQFAAGLLVICFAVDLFASWVLGKRLDHEIGRIHAAGEPLTLSEAAPPPVPFSANAASYYQQAFTLIPKTGASLNEDDIGLFLSDRTWQGKKISIGKVRGEIDRAAPALALARRAATMPKCQFPVNWDVGIGVQFPHFGKLRSLSQLLAARSVLEALEGHPVDALADLSAILGMAGHIAEEPAQISQLVAYGCLKTAERALHHILEISSPAPADARRLQQAIAAIDLYPPFVRALEGERCVGIKAFGLGRSDPRQISALFDSGGENGSSETGGVSHAFTALRIYGDRLIGGPFMKIDEAAYLQVMASEIDRAKRRTRTPTYPLSDYPSRSGVPATDVVTHSLLPDFGGIERQRDEAAARLELSQWALALRMDRGRTGGYPASLKDSSIAREWGLSSRDPYRSGDLIYRRQGVGYLLYSVGPNGRDDGGFNLRDQPIRVTPLGQSPVYRLVGSEDDIAWRAAA